MIIPPHTDHPALFRTIALAALLTLAAASARADFYRYQDDEGVETFTNTPTSSNARRFLRERQQQHGEAKAPLREEPSPLPTGRLPVRGSVTSGYGWRHDPIDGGIRHHNGVDIAVPTGTPVRAISGGRVVYSGWRGGYGNMVAIEHADGSQSLYGHNSQLKVAAGEQVEAGQVVALSGSTGRSTGPHLHFELWKRSVNVTEAYLRNGAGIPEVAVAGTIRSYLHQDGSIVFTNQ